MATRGSWTGGRGRPRPNPSFGHAALQVEDPRQRAHHSLWSPAVGDANDCPACRFLKVLGQMLLEPANAHVHVDTMK